MALAPKRLGLFVTCVNDTLFPAVGRAVISVLERLGHSVEFPFEQTCCGQIHLNSGYPQEALALAQRLGDIFEDYDAVVTPSASCAATLRQQLDSTATPVYEFSELIVDVVGAEDVGAYYPHRVTYHPTCHSMRDLKLGDRPLALLRAVRGIDLVELPASDECCGFGGTFAVKNADSSTAILWDKLGSIQQTQAEVVCAVDSSCLMHIGGGLSRGQAGVRTVHLAEILASTEEGVIG